MAVLLQNHLTVNNRGVVMYKYINSESNIRLFKVDRMNTKLYVYAFTNSDGTMGLPISPFFGTTDDAELFALRLYDVLYEPTLGKDGKRIEDGPYEMFADENLFDIYDEEEDDESE